MPTLIDKVLGIVLAGGQSSRMGTDKAKLVLHNKTLLENAVNLLIACNVKQVCVSGRKYKDEWVLDAFPGKGPLGGIYSVLTAEKYKQYELALVIPVDMPFLNSKTMKELVLYIEQYQAVCYEHYPLPLLLKKNDFLMQSIDEMFLKTGTKLSIKRLLKLHHTKYMSLAMTNGKCFTNVNTTDDWLSLHGFK